MMTTLWSMANIRIPRRVSRIADAILSRAELTGCRLGVWTGDNLWPCSQSDCRFSATTARDSDGPRLSHPTPDRTAHASALEVRGSLEAWSEVTALPSALAPRVWFCPRQDNSCCRLPCSRTPPRTVHPPRGDGRAVRSVLSNVSICFCCRLPRSRTPPWTVHHPRGRGRVAHCVSKDVGSRWK
jgi:hypothetical protein